jgi:hypothetical protein
MNALIIQHYYNKLYKELMKYIWDIECIELIAEVQLECYKAIINTKVLQKKLEKLRSFINSEFNDDEELKKRFETLYNASKEYEYIPYKLPNMEAK